ncbi:hypothetical protein FALBO_11499 [Fusarium albosuccineum]|uniref:Uncharacterized protein n=1 Tax=Fusarium albosuccineum TaxID=1237068 RepID=A0A8H4L4X8_9HYPO|nr:hypothetical protein FALBO_11499 [Fusarium albosuccineum]
MLATIALFLLTFPLVAAVELKTCNDEITRGIKTHTISPNDPIFFHNGTNYMSQLDDLQLTIEGCIKTYPKPNFDLYDDMWPRLLTWLLPALLLVGNLHVARVGTVNRLFATLHFMGDPIDSAWSLLTKAEVWNRFYAIAFHHTAPAPDSEAMARAYAAILSAFEELTNDMSSVSKELQTIINENGARLDKQDMEHIMLEAAEELVDSRSNEVLRTCLVIFNYLWSVLSALVPEIGGKQSSQPGGRIGTAMFLSFLVTVVMLSNTLSGFVSCRTCLRIMERYCRTLSGKKRDQHVFLNSPLLASKLGLCATKPGPSIVDFIDTQPWTGSLYYRPRKSLPHAAESDRSLFHLLMLSLAPVLIATSCAFVIIWFTLTIGLDCRSLWVISCGSALMLSPVLTWLIQVFCKGQLAWCLTVAKDFMLGVPILIVIVSSSIGVFNTCTCWGSVFSRGHSKAYVRLDPISERVYNAHHIYPAMVATCLGLQLVTYALMIRVMRPGAKVFRPDEDTKMKTYRHVHGFNPSETEMHTRSHISNTSHLWHRRSTASSDAGELLLPPPALSPHASPQLGPHSQPTIWSGEYSVPGNERDWARSERVSSYAGSPQTTAGQPLLGSPVLRRF